MIAKGGNIYKNIWIKENGHISIFRGKQKRRSHEESGALWDRNTLR